MINVPKTAPSAQNRYLYYGGQLNRLPSSLGSALVACFKLPVLRSIFPQCFRDLWAPRNEDLDSHGYDESLDTFIVRRFGEPVASNLVSAIIHGIYAGDIRELSVRSVFPSLVEAEQVNGGIMRSALPRWLNPRYRRPAVDSSAAAAADVAAVERRLDPALVAEMKRTSIYSFPEGLGEVVSALEAHIAAAPHVEIWKEAPCDALVPSPEGPMFIATRHQAEPLVADRVVATLPSGHLSLLLPDLPHLEYNPRAHLAVVDVVLAPPAGSNGKVFQLPVHGFGYLVPRSAEGNDDQILGVVFDSDAVGNQGPDSDSFVKLTVMMGGPYWKQAMRFPSEDELEARALRALVYQLGLPEEQVRSYLRRVRVRLLQNTIPQYLVGHPARMRELHAALRNDARYRERLTLLGCSYTGVGVNDCVAGALDAGDAIAEAELGRGAPDTSGLACMSGV